MSQKPPQSTTLLGTGTVLTTEEFISSHVPTSRAGGGGGGVAAGFAVPVRMDLLNPFLVGSRQ